MCKECVSAISYPNAANQFFAPSQAHNTITLQQTPVQLLYPTELIICSYNSTEIMYSVMSNILIVALLVSSALQVAAIVATEAPLTSCLAQSGGRYNIGCPDRSLCFQASGNMTSPYDLLCDGTEDCTPPLDEGNLFPNLNILINCEESDNTTHTVHYSRPIIMLKATSIHKPGLHYRSNPDSDRIRLECKRGQSGLNPIHIKRWITYWIETRSRLNPY